MGFFWEEGRDPSWSKQSNFTSGQNRLFSNDLRNTSNLGQGGFKNATSLLQQYLNPESDIYSNFEQPYLNQFNQQIVPGLAERFAGLNAMGSGLSTSGFGQALGAAGANLQTQLASMKQQYQRQSINDLLNQYNQSAGRGLSTRSFENTYDPGTQGQLGFGGNLLMAGATAAGTALGGPLGGALSSGLSGLFSGGGNSSVAQNPFSIGGQSGQSGYKGTFGNLPNFGGF